MKGKPAIATGTTRRGLFLGAVAGIGLAASTMMDSAAAAGGGLPIVDTHQHLWDMKKFRPPWLSGPAEAKINRPYTMDDYRRETAGLTVVKTIYMEVDVDPRQQIEEADWVAEICKRRDTLMAAGVVSARPASKSFKSYAMRYKDNPYIKGFRQVLQVPDAQPGLCLQSDYVRSIRLCGEFGKTFDLCMRPEELPDGKKLAELCPHTRFVLDHCGNASARNPKWAQWERDITEIAKQKNVVCKVSGIIKTVKPGWNAGEELEPIVRHVIQSFGPDRVMFGGDWPVCNKTSTFKGWVEALRYILRDATPEDQRKLFHDNAVRFYGLR